MKQDYQRDYQWAYAVLRLAVGLDLFGHGFIRLAGHSADFQAFLAHSFEHSLLPAPLVTMTGWIVPPAELILGVFLLIGWRTRETLLAASALMMVLIFGSCLIQNWEIVGLQLGYVLIYSVLIAFRSNNFFCVDKN